jgi:hypothetical protein
MKNRIFNLYVNFICEECGITREELFSSTREIRLSIPRYILYYVCAKRPIKIVEIRSLMNSNGFSVTRQNIDYGIEKVNKSTDKDVWTLIETCIEKFNDQ